MSATGADRAAVRVTVKDRVVEYDRSRGFVKCSRCAYLFRFAVRDAVWGLCCPGCLTPLTKATKKKYRKSRAVGVKIVVTDPLFIDFARSDPGSPLGMGMPSGSTLREDGESHREAWKRILRFDSCAYCGQMPSGTVDHIEAQSRPARFRSFLITPVRASDATARSRRSRCWSSWVAAPESCFPGRRISIGSRRDTVLAPEPKRNGYRLRSGRTGFDPRRVHRTALSWEAVKGAWCTAARLIPFGAACSGSTLQARIGFRVSGASRRRYGLP